MNRYYALPQGHERSALVKRGNTVIAEVFTDREPGDQHQTATLYAAAPAMLAALEKTRTMVWNMTGDDAACAPWNALLPHIDAAIANAKGGQP